MQRHSTFHIVMANMISAHINVNVYNVKVWRNQHSLHSHTMIFLSTLWSHSYTCKHMFYRYILIFFSNVLPWSFPLDFFVWWCCPHTFNTIQCIMVFSYLSFLIWSLSSPLVCSIWWCFPCTVNTFQCISSSNKSKIFHSFNKKKKVNIQVAEISLLQWKL